MYQFTQLKSVIYNEEREPKGNARKRFPMYNIPVYYHVDVSANCLDIDLPDIEPDHEYEKYARASQNITLYGLTSEDIPVQGEIPEHNVAIEVVDPNVVPDHLREKLINKYLESQSKAVLGVNRTKVDIISQPQ